MSATLKKITAEAKRIRKRSPRTSWTSAVKQAGAKYRSGKIGGKPARKKAAKKVAKKAAPKKRVGMVKISQDAFGKATVSGIMASAKKVLLQDIGKMEAKKFAATTKREKSQIAKKIAEKKRQYRKLK